MIRFTLLEFINKEYDMTEKRHVFIDGSSINSERDFHKYISSCFEFGPYYGNNLDALWDMLSSGIGNDVMLHWKNSNLSRERLGGKFDVIVSLFEKEKNKSIKLGFNNYLELSLE